MNIVQKVLGSKRFMAFILLTFAVSIAIATFIENDFGTAVARKYVYNAKWFELILALGCLNILVVIWQHRLYNKKKLTLFIFHISFVIILLGAVITRYFSYEGTMHIREGEKINQIISEPDYLQLSFKYGEYINKYYEKLNLTNVGNNNFKKRYHFFNTQAKITLKKFIPNAAPTISFNETGKAMLKLVISGNHNKIDKIMELSERFKKEDINLHFRENFSNDNEIQIIPRDGALYIKSPVPFRTTGMMTEKETLYKADSIYPILLRTVYTFNNSLIVFSHYLPQAMETVQELPMDPDGNNRPAIQLEIKTKNDFQEIILLKTEDIQASYTHVNLDPYTLSLKYGPKQIVLPFFLVLNEFILERYPGSETPSWYESKIILIDPARNLEKNERIFMNNVLNYRGYRFFQTSYDEDEKGTYLTVTHDFAGTLVTYLGYALLAMGIFLNLFNKHSRFRKLGAAKMTGILILGLIIVSNQQLKAEDSLRTVPNSHAQMFGNLLIQDNGGRIKPVNTYSSEILRKVYRNLYYKGLNPDQVIIGMLFDPEKWQQEPLIKVSHHMVKEILRIDGKYISFADMFQEGYLLKPYVEEAYKKKPAYRSKFDNDIIKVNERVNICFQLYLGNLFKIFPVPDDSTDTWYSPGEAYKYYTGEDSVFVKNIFPFYYADIHKAFKTDDWQAANETVQAISAFQRNKGKELIPPDFKLELEVRYNHINLFDRLASVYGLLGFLLLILQFIGIFYYKLELRIPVIITIVLVCIAFVLHAAGLAIRWYIAGHAPWSNGYEALIYIAWATVLAGLVFAKKSSITLSVTAILAFIILHVAHLSWMDPEITHLVPVLKSYWLIIHVAVITSSYGFLALGALLAGINLILMMLASPKKYAYLKTYISKITLIIEMTVIVGLYLLTIGTFLGGIWANESWGRYWAWDPKETWALVTILVYAFIAHLRIIPSLQSEYLFNLLSLIGFGSVIMTYFGVNYYLTGLHSYAKGDPLPVPAFIYYTIAIIAIISILAYANRRRCEKTH